MPDYKDILISLNISTYFSLWGSIQTLIHVLNISNGRTIIPLEGEVILIILYGFAYPSFRLVFIHTAANRLDLPQPLLWIDS